HIGALVGCELPPSGSSVMASACVSDMVFGGFSTIAENVPLASGQNVIEGMGLPDFFEINQSCSMRFSPGLGTFPPRIQRPISGYHTASSCGNIGSLGCSMIFFDFGSLQIMASWACVLATRSSFSRFWRSARCASACCCRLATALRNFCSFHAEYTENNNSAATPAHS